MNSFKEYLAEIGGPKHSPEDIKRRDALMKGQTKLHQQRRDMAKKEKHPYLKGLLDPLHSVRKEENENS